MKQSEFTALDKLADEVDEKAEEWLQSEALSELRAALEKAAASLPEGYQVTLDIKLNVFDEQRERTIELLSHGLCFSLGIQAFEASGTSSPHRYVVDGELCELPHDYCPHCWAEWVMKLERPTCPTCGYEMGNQVKLLLDNDLCPFCEDGEITLVNPQCQKCDYEVNPEFIAWG